MSAVHHHAHLTCVDEEHLAWILLLAIEEPYAHRNGDIIKELIWHGNNALHKVSLDKPTADAAFTTRCSSERPIGKHKSDATCWREVMHHVLNPCIVGVAFWGHSILPAHIVSQAACSPFTHIERRISHDEVELLGGVPVIAKRITPAFAKVSFEATDGKVHVRHLPCVGAELLSVDSHVAQVALMLLDELGALHEHTTRATGRVIDATLKRLQHFNYGADKARRSIELTS